MVNMWVCVMMLMSAACVSADEFRRVACTEAHDAARHQIVENNSCKLMITQVELKAKHLYHAVHPTLVKVNRCMGVCSEHRHNCIGSYSAKKRIPVRINDDSTGKEFCAMFHVEDTTECVCVPPV